MTAICEKNSSIILFIEAYLKQIAFSLKDYHQDAGLLICDILILTQA
jgi:hypothetical protein